MTRPQFFAAIAALFGAKAVAQQFDIPRTPTGLGGGYPKPANGQCPTCFKRTEVYHKNPGSSIICVTTSTEGVMDQKKCWPAKLVRCSHCSAAFYQDAE